MQAERSREPAAGVIRAVECCRGESRRQRQEKPQARRWRRERKRKKRSAPRPRCWVSWYDATGRFVSHSCTSSRSSTAVVSSPILSIPNQKLSIHTIHSNIDWLCLRNDYKMKLSLATALVGILPLAMAKSIIVYYPKGTPSSVIDDGKKHITNAVWFICLLHLYIWWADSFSTAIGWLYYLSLP